MFALKFCSGILKRFFFVLLVVISVTATCRAGTFYNPVDDPDGIGRIASAELNLCIASFYQVLAALEVGDNRGAESARQDALAECHSAIERFKNAANNTRNESFDRSDLDPQSLEAFDRLLIIFERQGIEPPSTLSDLAGASVALSQRFSSYLFKLPTEDLIENQQWVHEIIEQSLLLQDVGVLVSKVWVGLAR
jgi:hypothetical protein